ncbi:MAG: hypothetical protein RIM33_04515 [Alphaproteobacteria bacterium]
MTTRPNSLKLNKLQARTLALAQVVAKDPALAHRDDATGDTHIPALPHPHGDHVHIGSFVVSTREISGFSNPAVWAALTRKGLAKETTLPAVTLTQAGLDYDTGLGHLFQTVSDH